MENQSNSVTPLAMSYGLYMGLALILNTVVFYVMGSPFSHTTAYIVYGIIIGGIIWGMKSFRDEHQEVGVTYGKALGLGTLQALFASLIYAFFTFVLFTLIDKTLTEKFLSFLEEEFTRSGITESQIDTIMPMYRKFMSPVFYSFAQIFSIVFYGFLFSLVLAIFFRKQSTNPFHGVE
ncbi:MAG: DUF4199 domain-containing protein [Mariniphaga sp.]